MLTPVTLPENHRQPALRKLSRAATGALVALAFGGPVLAQQPASEAATPAASLIGRWTGVLSFGLGRIDRAATHVTVYIGACGDNLCGQLAGADGSCGARILELIAEPSTEATRTGAPSHRGRLVLSGQPPLAVAAFHSVPASGRTARLELREAETPLYSRRLPQTFSATLERTGPSTCEPRRTS